MEPLSRISPKNPASGQRSGIFFCWVHLMTVTIYGYTLPEANSSHMPRSHSKKGRKSSNHPFSGAMSVSGSVFLKLWKY